MIFQIKARCFSGIVFWEYDKEVLEFYYSDEEIMNTKIQLRDYDIGNAYFSVVVNNEID